MQIWNNGSTTAMRSVYIDTFGGDPTGLTDSTGAFQRALAALPTVTIYANPSNHTGASATYHQGTILFGSGTYKLGSSGDIGNVGPFVSIIGPGHNACKLDYHGSGDCIRLFNAVNPSSGTFDTLAAWAGKLDGFMIDGTNAAAGASGLHYGDTEGGILGPDLYIFNFSGVGSKGIWFDNTVSWTENIWGRMVINNCTTCVLFDVQSASTISNSFEYNDLTFKVYCEPNQNAIVLQNGAYYGNGVLRVRGNFARFASPQTSSCLTLQGKQVVSNVWSQFADCHLDIQVESNLSGNPPTTITFVSTTNNGIFRCFGILNFQAFWGASNWSVAGSFAQGNFTFTGQVSGDPNLSTVGDAGLKIIGPLIYGISQGFPDGGMPNHQGDFFTVTLTQNMTVALQFNIAGPQRKTFLFQQAAAGGPFTVTWPKPGSPTLSTPAVYWPGGTAPTMSTGANAVDMYKLETFDGVHWYGSAVQNLS